MKKLRALKLFVMFGIPVLGFIYAYQFTQQSREIIVPFRTFKAPTLVVEAPGATAAAQIPLRSPVTVVNYWATWCPPCVEEFPAMIELQRQLEGKGVEVVFVSVDEKWSDVEKFLAINNIHVAPGRLLWDPKKVAALEWGSTKFPETYVVRRDGWIVEKIIGGQQWTRPVVIQYFADLGAKFAKIVETVSSWLIPSANAQDRGTAQADMLHEDDRKNLEKLRANIEVASKNLRNSEAALKEEKRNLEEQKVVYDRRKKEESESDKEVDKLKVKRTEVKTILDKNTDSQNAEKNERKEAEGRVRKIQDKIKDLQRELEEQKSKLLQANKDVNTRMQQIETYEEARKSSQEELESLEKRVKYAEGVLKERKGAANVAESELKARDRKAKDLTSQVEKAQKVLTDQKNKLTEFEKVLQR